MKVSIALFLNHLVLIAAQECDYCKDLLEACVAHHVFGDYGACRLCLDQRLLTGRVTLVPCAEYNDRLCVAAEECHCGQECRDVVRDYLEWEQDAETNCGPDLSCLCDVEKSKMDTCL